VGEYQLLIGKIIGGIIQFTFFDQNNFYLSLMVQSDPFSFDE
jgi:hypothetical protein